MTKRFDVVMTDRERKKAEDKIKEMESFPKETKTLSNETKALPPNVWQRENENKQDLVDFEL